MGDDLRKNQTITLTHSSLYFPSEACIVFVDLPKIYRFNFHEFSLFPAIEKKKV